MILQNTFLEQVTPDGFLNRTPERVKVEGDDMIFLPALVPQVSELTLKNIVKGHLEFLRRMAFQWGEQVLNLGVSQSKT